MISMIEYLQDAYSSGDIFWYQLKLPGSGHDFVPVNALKATRQGGFTEDTLAQEVQRLMGRWIDIYIRL
ncbi:hypothetical protein HDV62DRAFT_372861 [Trichoderma sp. SZMC 28011]